MNFLIFASAVARAKIMRIHTHEWKLITLIFENQLNYVLIRGYKKNKQQQTNNSIGYRSESKIEVEGPRNRGWRCLPRQTNRCRSPWYQDQQEKNAMNFTSWTKISLQVKTNTNFVSLQGETIVLLSATRSNLSTQLWLGRRGNNRKTIEK